MSLKIGMRGFELPDESVTETFAMLAKRGMGKSNAAVVMAEEMWDRGHQWVAIDPKGDWWGIRSSASGTDIGLPVLVLGGRHGDLPLEATSGEVLARLVVEQNITCVLDVSLFSKADQIRFVTDFAETLFRAVGDDPRPLHLFLEEAEEFVPQRVDARSARMVGAYSKIAKQGRTLGLGVTLITQRSASLNKDALSQTDTLILFRTVSPHDRKAVVAWAEHHDEAKEVAESLAQLQPGESWVLSPGFLGTIQRVKWRRRRTFDSGATPRSGRKVEPRTVADIDLAEIKELMAETIERAQADDPKLLRKRIAELERELANRQPEVEVREVEVEVRHEAVPQSVLDRIAEIDALLQKHWREASDYASNSRSALEVDAPPPRREHIPSRRESRPSEAPATYNGSGSEGEVKLDKRSRSILTVLAQFPHGRTQRQIALLTGYSPKSSTISAGLSALRKAGYITSSGMPMITQEGLDALGDSYEPLPRGHALYEHWMSQLGKRERVFLETLVDAYPDEVSPEELADAGGYSVESSTISAGMSKLRGLELADGWRAHPDFIEAIQGGT